MIPKMIHYAWFGGKKPAYVIENIKSWKEFFPDAKIVEWNEENWDVNSFEFSAYYAEKGLWGYVIDPLRVDVLNRFGGIWIDADVTLKKDISSFLENTFFLGMHYNNAVGTALVGSIKQEPIISGLVDYYHTITTEQLKNPDFDAVSNGIFTRYFLSNVDGFKLTNSKQDLEDGVVIYPKHYFVLPPFFSRLGGFAEHEMVGSWKPHVEDNAGVAKKLVRRLLGRKLLLYRRNYKQMKNNGFYEDYLKQKGSH